MERLEAERQQLLAEMTQVGDLRRGSIAETYRRCGKPNCICAQPGQRGHGPRYLLVTKVGGRTRAVDLHPGPELRKVQREVANHRRFRALVQQVIEANEQICAVRPVLSPDTEQPASAETLKKTSPASAEKSPPAK